MAVFNKFVACYISVATPTLFLHLSGRKMNLRCEFECESLGTRIWKKITLLHISETRHFPVQVI